MASNNDKTKAGFAPLLFNPRTLAVALAALITAGGFYMWGMGSTQPMSAISIHRNQDGGFTFKLDGEPFLIKGVCYNPVPVGKDYQHKFWADPDKPWIEDGKLLEKMGANAIRLYRTGEDPEAFKVMMSDLYNKNGIRSFVGHHLGFWEWPPANYASESFQNKTIQDVVKMVQEYKDEPAVLGWVLGNENNYSFDQNIRSWSSDAIDAIDDPKKRWEEKAKVYYAFVNKLAEEVKKVDPTRPVIMGIGEIKSLQFAKSVTPNVDILGVIAYRGATFGSLFREIKQKYDKPVLMIEYGADRYNAYTREEDETSQARFIKNQWIDIQRNSTANKTKGNVIGGLVFEWTDEWWKANEGLAHTWSAHDTTGQWSNSSYHYDYEVPGRQNINEEWWGVVGLNPRPKSLKKGLDQRVPKEAYYVLEELWNKESYDDEARANLQVAETKAPSQSTPEQNVAPVATNQSQPQVASQAAAPTTNEIVTNGPVEVPDTPLPVRVDRNADGGYTLYVGDSPYYVQGIYYNPAPIGQGKDYQLWSDSGKPWVSDSKALKELGANSVILYGHDPESVGTKRIVGDLYKDSHIRTFLGDKLNIPGVDVVNYSDPEVKAQLNQQVLSMVQTYKDEPGILGWILGYDNNLSFDEGVNSWSSPVLDLIDDPEQKRKTKARIYYSFINDLAKEIKSVDPDRPVILGISGSKSLAVAAEETPDVDILGINSFKGPTFLNLFEDVRKLYDKPVLITAFGADRFNALTNREAEDLQANYLVHLWKDLEINSTKENNRGNVLGGFVFEWVDQWWRADQDSPISWKIHDKTSQWSEKGYYYDYLEQDPINVNIEWFGLMGVERTASGVDKRVPKKAFYALKSAWTEGGCSNS